MKNKFSPLNNPRIFHDYHVITEYDCGMVLTSIQVKDIRENRASIVGTWCKFMNGELFLIGKETIKLMLTKKELNSLIGKTQEKGMTMAPISIYEKKGFFKLRMGLCRGKKEYDKRESDKKRDIEMDNRRTVKSQKFGDE